MKIPTSMPRLKGYRFPREIIACAVRAYHRFALGTADVEDLLAERGVIASRETIRLWAIVLGRIVPLASAVTDPARTTSGTSTRL